MLIIIHAISSVIALLLGALVLKKNKGDQTHRLIGRLFGISMLFSALSSFGIFNKHFSAIHIFSGLVIFLLFKAIYAVRYKPKNWLYVHSSSMVSAYLSIIIAGSGVVVRKIILPGNSSAGYIVSFLTAFALIGFSGKITKHLKQ